MAEPNKAAFVAGATGRPLAPGKPKLKASRGNDPAADWFKVLGFGIPGSGKTQLIVGLLQMGERVFVADTDFGGNGLRTVKQALKKIGREDLLANLASFDFTSYEEFAMFLQDPMCVEIPLEDGTSTDIYTWAPTWIAQEGYTNYQKNHLDEYVLSLAPGTKNSSAQREVGLRAEQQDWDAIKRGTFRNAGDFLTLHNKKTGQKWSKLVTAYEGTPRENEITHEIKSGPDLQGGARNWFNGGFDLVVRLFAKNGKEGPAFFYEINPAKSFTKNRGFDFPSEMPADPLSLFQKITGKGNVVS